MQYYVFRQKRNEHKYFESSVYGEVILNGQLATFFV